MISSKPQRLTISLKLIKKQQLVFGIRESEGRRLWQNIGENVLKVLTEDLVIKHYLNYPSLRCNKK